MLITKNFAVLHWHTLTDRKACFIILIFLCVKFSVIMNFMWVWCSNYFISLTDLTETYLHKSQLSCISHVLYISRIRICNVLIKVSVCLFDFIFAGKENFRDIKLLQFFLCQKQIHAFGTLILSWLTQD